MNEHATIHVLDLGSSQIPDRIKTLALRHPKRRFVAVDQHPPWPGEKLPTNAEYVTSEVIQYLKSLRNESVQIINADFVLNELSDEQIRELMAHAKRVLMPNGKFYLSEDRQNVQDLRDILHEHGFSSFAREVSKKEAEEPVRGLRTKGSYTLRSGWTPANGNLLRGPCGL